MDGSQKRIAFRFLSLSAFLALTLPLLNPSPHLNPLFSPSFLSFSYSTMLPSLVRSVFKRTPVAIAKKKKVLSILEPKGWKHTKGGTVSPESLRGVYEGRKTVRGE